MKLMPYLSFEGNCREAIDFYKNVFECGEPNITYFRDMEDDPEYPLAEEYEHYILHAVLKIRGFKLHLSDKMPNSEYNTANDIMSIVITNINADTATRLFGALSEGGKIIVPLGASFWSPAYGSLVDKFGVSWKFSAD